MNTIVNQFLTSNIANQCIQSLTKDHGINAQEAKKVVDATAEGTAQIVGKGGFDLNQMLKSFGGMGGTQPQGLPPTIVKSVSDYVANKTGLSTTIVSAAVSMILPKILEFAKGTASPV